MSDKETNTLLEEKLIAKLAAVTAERDMLAALVREVVETLPPQYEPGELTPYCPWCGNNMWKDHEPTCIHTRARRALAALDAAAEDGT